MVYPFLQVPIYEDYFLDMGTVVLIVGIAICVVTFAMVKFMKNRDIDFV